jgi:Rrf2 family protein
MVCLAEKSAQLTAVDIAKKLGISKIYLEQVLSLLKGTGLINSVKGFQGGYHLDAAAREVTVLDILKATEPSLFEHTEPCAADVNAGYIEKAVQSTVWEKLDASIAALLGGITLQDLADNCKKQGGYMFYI